MGPAHGVGAAAVGVGAAAVGMGAAARKRRGRAACIFRSMRLPPSFRFGLPSQPVIDPALVQTRRLMLARHAKSSLDDASLGDHERPLSEEGCRSAIRIGNLLTIFGFVPDLVYCSTAVRTRKTWERFERALVDEPPRVEFRKDLYLAPANTVLSTIESSPAEAQTLMVLGHNPSTHALAARLARAGDPGALDFLRRKFPTGTVAVIDLDSEHWADAEAGGELVHLFVPGRRSGSGK